MFALTVLLILVAYLLISLGVILATRAMARRRGGRPWLWGWVAAIAMYHLVFWDLIPTAILYPYYQSQEAGIWVYKTPEQWLAENQGVDEALVLKQSSDITFVRKPFLWKSPLNQRLTWIGRHIERWPQIIEVEDTIVDVSNGEVLVRAVYFQSGDCTQPQYYRLWIQHCGESTHTMRNKFYAIKSNYNLGRDAE